MRYDRAGRPWVFVRGQLHVDGYSKIKQDQFVFKNDQLGERTFTATYRDFDGEEIFDLIHSAHPAAQAFGNPANVDFIAVIITIVYRMNKGTVPTWGSALKMAQTIHSELFQPTSKEP